MQPNKTWSISCIYIGKWWTSCYWFSTARKRGCLCGFPKDAPSSSSLFCGMFFWCFICKSQSRKANLYLVLQARASHSRHNVAEQVEAVCPFFIFRVSRGEWLSRGYLNPWVWFLSDTYVGWSFCFHSDWVVTLQNIYQPDQPDHYIDYGSWEDHVDFSPYSSPSRSKRGLGVERLNIWSWVLGMLCMSSRFCF